MKITSNIIKTILMHKFRYVDGHLVASEIDVVGTMSIADLLVYDLKKDSIFEVEVKVSKSDLKADIKKMKHNVYTNDFKSNSPCISKFYYAVPTKLVEACKDMLDEHNLPYGIIEISSEIIGEDWSAKSLRRSTTPYSSLVRITKRAPKLNESKISERQKYVFLKRMASEVVSSSRKILEQKEEIKRLSK